MSERVRERATLYSWTKQYVRTGKEEFGSRESRLAKNEGLTKEPGDEGRH